MRRVRAVAFALGLSSLACGNNPVTPVGNDGAAGADGARSDAALALAAFEGIYTIQDVTLNPTSCAAEGPSDRANQISPLFAAAVHDFGNTAFLSFVACNDVADCQSKAAMAQSGRVSGIAWDYTVGGTGPDNGRDTFIVGAPSQDVCSGESIDHTTLTGDPRAMLRIQIEIVDVPTHAAVGGMCDFTATQAAAVGIPCARLKVVTGTFLQAL